MCVYLSLSLSSVSQLFLSITMLTWRTWCFSLFFTSSIQYCTLFVWKQKGLSFHLNEDLLNLFENRGIVRETVWVVQRDVTIEWEG